MTAPGTVTSSSGDAAQQSIAAQRLGVKYSIIFLEDLSSTRDNVRREQTKYCSVDTVILYYNITIDHEQIRGNCVPGSLAEYSCGSNRLIIIHAAAA